MAKEQTEKVVQVIYLTNENGPVHTASKTNQFSAEELHAMSLWKNLLNTDQMQAMVGASCEIFLQSGILEKENDLMKNVVDWIDMHEEQLWTALQEARHEKPEAIPLEAEPCFHLLCFMVCLSTVFSKVPTVGSDDKEKELAEHVWKMLMKKTDLPSNAMKLLPRKPTFDFVMREMSVVICDSFLARIGKWLDVKFYWNWFRGCVNWGNS